MSASPAPAPIPSWRRTMVVMIAVQGIISLALTAMAPILPAYLRQLGITTPQGIELWSGALMSVNFLLAALVSPIWGMLGDRFGRKAMVLRSTAAICLFTALMGFATHVWQLVALRGAMGLFSGFSATAIALMASQAPDHRLGYALGWLNSGQLVGALLGPVVSGAVAGFLPNERYVFHVAAALTGVAALMVAFLIRESFQRPTATQNKRLALRFGSPALAALFVVLLLGQGAVRTVQPVVALFVEQLAPGGHVALLAGLAFSITGIADLLAAPFLGRRSDQLGYRRVLLVSLLGVALMTLPQAFARNYAWFLAERFGVGLFLGGILPSAYALIGRLSDPAQRGAAYGLTSSASFLGNCLGPLLGGTVAATAGLRMVFPLTTALLLINWLWVWRSVPEVVDRSPPRNVDE